MSPALARHPRAALAIGAVVLSGWLAAIGLAIGTDASTDVESRAAPNGAPAEGPVARPGKAGPGYSLDGAD
jgi:hypothetical protein